MTAILNGDREQVYERWAADGGTWTISRVAAELGLGARQAGTVSREWKGRLAANGGGVTSGGLPPSSPAPRAIEKPNGRSQRTAPSPVQRWLRHHDPVKVAATAVVLAVGLAVSYSHIVHLALLAGAGWWAWVMPLPLDAMALVALLHVGTERRYAVAWAGLVVGALGSLAANVLAVDPSLADMRYVLWGFAALPPIAVVVCGHLLDRGARR